MHTNTHTHHNISVPHLHGCGLTRRWWLIEMNEWEANVFVGMSVIVCHSRTRRRRWERVLHAMHGRGGRGRARRTALCLRQWSGVQVRISQRSCAYRNKCRIVRLDSKSECVMYLRQIVQSPESCLHRVNVLKAYIVSVRTSSDFDLHCHSHVVYF